MRGIVWCATAVTVLILSNGANAASRTSGQQPGDELDDATIDSVTVEAARRELLEDQLSRFTSGITKSDPDESIARWQVPICLLVAGLPLEKGKFVFQRIAQIATESGVPLGPPDCAPNLRVVMTREPEEILNDWWRNNHRLFNLDRGAAGIKRTIRTPAPVRIFYNECSMPPDMVTGFSNTVMALCGESGIADSRLRRGAVRVLYSVIIVVDKGRVEGMELGALADYVAMSSLSHIRKNSRIGDAAPTILRLFDESGTPRPQALSTWDRAFLKALYDTDPGRVTQLAEIKHRMKRELMR